MGKVVFLLVMLAGICHVGAQGPATGGGQVKMDSEGFVVKTGDAAPDFTVTMFDGSTVNLRDLRGKVVFLDFSGPFCKPCIAAMKRFDKEIFGRFEGQDLEVLVILGLYKNRSDVEKFRTAQGFDFPMGLDPEHKVLNKYFIGGIPRYFVIDRAGKIVYHASRATEGDHDDVLNEIADAIDRTLKGK